MAGWCRCWLLPLLAGNHCWLETAVGIVFGGIGGGGTAAHLVRLVYFPFFRLRQLPNFIIVRLRHCQIASVAELRQLPNCVIVRLCHCQIASLPNGLEGAGVVTTVKATRRSSLGAADASRPRTARRSANAGRYTQYITHSIYWLLPTVNAGEYTVYISVHLLVCIKLSVSLLSLKTSALTIARTHAQLY